LTSPRKEEEQEKEEEEEEDPEDPGIPFSDRRFLVLKK
jgi:hypothetical protein